MELLKSVSVQCPWCGESIDILIDCSIGHQAYTEDCSICCQPMLVDVASADGQVEYLTVEAENR